MLSSKRARHARPSHSAQHARPSQAPARIAAATAAGGFLLPLAAAAPADAAVMQRAAVQVAAPRAAVQPGAAAVSVRLISDGRYVSGAPVEIQIPEGSGWRTIARAGTGSYGLAHATVAVRRDTRVRAYYRGSSTRSPATSSSAVVTVQDVGQRVLDEAGRHQGAPYVYGATGPYAFDCSGFTRYVFATLGVSLPHNAAAQQSMSQPVSRANIRIGDLVFLDGGGHVGIYAGNGQMWDAPRSGQSVSLRRIYSSGYAVGRVIFS